MSLALKKEKIFTYKDYISWPDDERWELINGVAYDMTPAPSTRHQRVVINLSRIFENNLEGKSCTSFIAPTDVVLSEYDIVQPDLLIVCDKNKITNANIQGTPDLIIEILSPSTALKDKRDKKALYEKYGVKEYIIFDIIEKYVERFYIKEDGKYYGSDIFGSDETLNLFSLEGMKIPLSEIFEEE